MILSDQKETQRQNAEEKDECLFCLVRPTVLPSALPPEVDDKDEE